MLFVVLPQGADPALLLANGSFKLFIEVDEALPVAGFEGLKLPRRKIVQLLENRVCLSRQAIMICAGLR